MKFPDAHKGVKKLYVAEIISIIAAAIGIISLIFSSIGLKNDGVLATMGLIASLSAIALLVSFIMQLVGLKQGGEDEDQIRYAFYCSLLAIAFSLAVVVVRLFKENDTTVMIRNIFDIGVDVSNVLVVIYALLGISALATKLGDGAMAQRGKKLSNVVTVLFVVSIAFNLFPNFFTNNAPDWAKVIASIIAIVAAIVELIAYVLIVVYYGKASKMLEK